MVFVLVLKVNQSDNLYQATRVSVMYNVYISGEMLVLFVLKMNQFRQLVPSHERHVQCISIGIDVGGVCPCSKGEPVRQPVPSHERHVQCICIGRDVGGVCACFKGEPVRQSVPSHERHVQCICIGRDVGGCLF